MLLHEWFSSFVGEENDEIDHLISIINTDSEENDELKMKIKMNSKANYNESFMQGLHLMIVGKV